MTRIIVRVNFQFAILELIKKIVYDVVQDFLNENVFEFNGLD